MGPTIEKEHSTSDVLALHGFEDLALHATMLEAQPGPNCQGEDLPLHPRRHELLLMLDPPGMLRGN